MRGNARGHGVRWDYGRLQFFTICFVYLILGLSVSIAGAKSNETLGEGKPRSLRMAPRSAYGYDLIAYIRLNSIEGSLENADPSIPRYDRREHFGGWRIHRSREKCSRTREVVLFRQALPDAKIETNEHCRVTAGAWIDPYSGREITNPRDLHIDHVVPLQHAYYAGAYSWRPALRCHYTNYIYNTYHLLAVYGRENVKKGERTPAHYIPPNPEFRCEYLSGWMKIKIIWQLWSTVEEVQAIESQFVAENCPDWMRYISVSEYEEQRKIASNPIPSCLRFEKQKEKEAAKRRQPEQSAMALAPAS